MHFFEPSIIGTLLTNLKNLYFDFVPLSILHPHALVVSAFRRPPSCHPTLIPVSLGTGFTPTTLAPVSMTSRFSNPHVYSLRTKKRTDGRNELMVECLRQQLMENTKRMVRGHGFEGDAQALGFEVCGLLVGVG
jgi:hypothetical protein